jgi:hypothetical protein
MRPRGSIVDSCGCSLPLGCVITVLVTMNGTVLLSIHGECKRGFVLCMLISVNTGFLQGAFSGVVSFFAASITYDLAFWLRCCCPF